MSCSSCGSLAECSPTCGIIIRVPRFRFQPNKLRSREFACATQEQIKYWRFGGEEETHYTGRDWPWKFCVEAHRPVCVQHRACGRCKRDDVEWEKLLRLDRGYG